MNLSIKVNVENETGLSDEQALMLASLAHVQGLVDTFKHLGLTVDEAAARAAQAVRSAWDLGTSE